MYNKVCMASVAKRHHRMYKPLRAIPQIPPTKIEDKNCQFFLGKLISLAIVRFEDLKS